VAKREEKQMAESGHDEPDEGRADSARRDVVSPGDAAPRMARFGEGPEGRPARRERDVAGPRDGFFGRAAKFVRDVRSELGRVTWPSAVQVRNTTIITVIAVIFFAVYLFAVDRAFAFIIEQVQRLVGGA
jgi:preprotein translocase subunit SecE